ncbi:MAG: hypothetical protein NT092_10375 [Bacteroidia bacterium]|nr:hypothetical protein [Bacteroidia bacterium]
MVKNGLVLLAVSWLFLISCTQSRIKTEIKVQLSEAEYIYALVNDTRDSLFLSAYNYAKKIYDPGKDEFIDLFANRFMETDSNNRLAIVFCTVELKDKINFNTTNQEAIAIIREEIKNAIDITILVLNGRIASACKTTSFPGRIFDMPNVDVNALPGRNSYLFTVNRKADKTRITKLLESAGNFGVWETFFTEEIQYNLLTESDSINDNQLLSMRKPSFLTYSTGKTNNCLGVASLQDTTKVNDYFSRPDVKAYFPRSLKTAWGINPKNPERDSLNLTAIKISTRDDSAPINNMYINKVSVNKSKAGAGLRIKMTDYAKRILSRVTRDNIGREMAVMIDNLVYYNLDVTREINGGVLTIPGKYTPEEAEDQAILLNSVAIPENSVKVISIN